MQDIFEFGNGTDILLSTYNIPSLQFSFKDFQATIPLKLIVNPGKVVIKSESYLNNPFDFIYNCTIIENKRISTFVNIAIFNGNNQLNLIDLPLPITIVLRKILRFPNP